MIFVDTNYFLRFLLDDNHEQHFKARELIMDGGSGKKQLVTSLIVMFEIYWVLDSYYGKDKKEIAKVLQQILELEFIELAERSELYQAIKLYSKSSFCLEDCYNLIIAKRLGAKELATFDQKLLKEFKNSL